MNDNGTRVSGRVRYLHQIGALLWPGHQVTIGRERSGRPVREYLLVPHAREPRLMLPAPRRAAAAAVMGFNKGRSRKAATLSRALWAGLRSGAAGPLLRDRLRVYGDGSGIEDHLGEVLGRDVLMGLHVGPDRANRKPVAQLLTPRGVTVGYAKIGFNPLTRELVRAERTALEILAERPLRTLRVPRVAYAGRWNDLEILVLEPLPVWDRQVPADPARLHAVMREVAEAGGVERHRLAGSPYWKGLRERAGGLDGPQADGIRTALDRLAAVHGDREVPFGAWHGDWTAWNMAVLPDTMLVWDWERFTQGVPVGYDAVHFHMWDALTEGGVEPRKAAADAVAAAPRLLAPFGLDAETGTVVALLYLAELGTRYLIDRQDEAGAALGRLDTWLLPVLTERTA
ncbi:MULTISPECIES: hypothetical protein [Thermomonospora]|uniref:Aminoglycoside phosphotransferase domain-containing protein n=1 Tax=Thermomonospora cellulosilytica TaxID=1411118 RepID=A0A7W3MX98_9ACTN|nr:MULTISPECIES: hypothetical protein [Thermomonospora]MBA9003559.1 hypothetical protein [Thermomonospora cellulosilytica]